MSSPLSLDDIRCPGCGRVARVVRHESADAPAAPVGDDGCVLNLFPEDPSATTSVDRAAFWLMDCCCDRFHRSLGTPPTLRGLLTREDGITIGPGLGRLLVEVLERRSVVAGPSRDEIRATLRTLPADELLEWAVIGASPPAPNCGHRGSDGCCNHPDHVSAECHAGAPCPLVAIASAPRPSWRWAIPVGPGLYRDAFGRLTQGVWVSADGTATDDEPAYTSAPPPPSPDGVTWYRWRRIGGFLKYDHIRVIGSFFRLFGQGEDGGRTGHIDTFEGYRTLHPVPRPEWAEGEGE